MAEKRSLAEGLRGLQGSAEARGTEAGRARTAVANGNLAESPKSYHFKRLMMYERKGPVCKFVSWPGCGTVFEVWEPNKILF